MKRSAAENIMLGISILLTIVVLVLVASPVWASGDCKGRSCNSSGDVAFDITTKVSTGPVDVSTGPVNVHTGGNKSLALGNVLGDVDIAQCLGSTQWSTPIYGRQKLSLNWVCVAELYVRFGQGELAAMALCNTEIVKEFETEAECEAAHHFLVSAIESAAAEDVGAFDDGRFEQALMMQQELEARVVELQAIVERSQRPRPASDLEKRIAAARQIMQEAKE